MVVGFSNGANIASGLLLSRPGLFSGAALFRAMVTLVPDPLPALSARVLISNGRSDPLVSAEETERLARSFAAAAHTWNWPGSLAVISSHRVMSTLRTDGCYKL